MPRRKQYSPPRLTTNRGRPFKRSRRGLRSTSKVPAPVLAPATGSFSDSEAPPKKVLSFIHSDLTKRRRASIREDCRQIGATQFTSIESCTPYTKVPLGGPLNYLLRHSELDDVSNQAPRSLNKREFVRQATLQ